MLERRDEEVLHTGDSLRCGNTTASAQRDEGDELWTVERPAAGLLRKRLISSHWIIPRPRQ